ncbi:hypothetical protein V8E36_009638 [Tilletia maclaganii]
MPSEALLHHHKDHGEHYKNHHHRAVRYHPYQGSSSSTSTSSSAGEPSTSANTLSSSSDPAAAIATALRAVTPVSASAPGPAPSPTPSDAKHEALNKPALPAPRIPTSPLSSTANGPVLLDPLIQHPPTTTTTLNPPQPKRAQVRRACLPCKKACKKCDEVRPCTRCVRLGYGSELCVDVQRKARAKGVKRGKYKPRRKGGKNGVELLEEEEDDEGEGEAGEEGDGLNEIGMANSVTAAAAAAAAAAVVSAETGARVGGGDGAKDHDASGGRGHSAERPNTQAERHHGMRPPQPDGTSTDEGSALRDDFATAALAATAATDPRFYEMDLAAAVSAAMASLLPRASSTLSAVPSMAAAPISQPSSSSVEMGGTESSAPSQGLDFSLLQDGGGLGADVQHHIHDHGDEHLAHRHHLGQLDVHSDDEDEDSRAVNEAAAAAVAAAAAAVAEEAEAEARAAAAAAEATMDVQEEQEREAVAEAEAAALAALAAAEFAVQEEHQQQQHEGDPS